VIYPIKKKKNKQKKQTIIAIIIKNQDKYLLKKRSEGNLLVNLWEFPNFVYEEETSEEEDEEEIIIEMQKYLKKNLIKKYDGEVSEYKTIFHDFSHIKQKILVFDIEIEGENQVLYKIDKNNCEYFTKNEIENDIPISTQMKKVFSTLFENDELSENDEDYQKKKKRKKNI
jgi:adenine-specific DNA glycosylase